MLKSDGVKLGYLFKTCLFFEIQSLPKLMLLLNPINKVFLL